MRKKSVETSFRFYASIIGVAVIVICVFFYVRLQAEGPASSISTGGAEQESMANSKVLKGTELSALPVVTGGKPVFHIDTVFTNRGTFPIPDEPGVVTVAVATGGSITIAGWAVDVIAHKAAGGVVGVIDNREKFAASYGGSRPDVATALTIPAYEKSAFSITIGADALPPGKHLFRINILSADRTKFFSTAKEVTLDVTP